MQTPRPVTKPTKQRKRLFQAPAHIRHKLLAAHLAPELRGSHIVRSFPVRSGDTVRVMRGDRKGFEGKVSRVDLKTYRIYVEGLSREKVDGTTIFVPVHPSKVLVTHLNLDDDWRKKILERKKKAVKKPKAARQRPKAKPEEKLGEIAEKETAQEEKPATEEKAIAETAERTTEEKEEAKQPARRKQKTIKKKPAATAQTKVKEATKEAKPQPEKKATRRRTTKKKKEGDE
jgi:large subunit ribosomal protein L24